MSGSDGREPTAGPGAPDEPAAAGGSGGSGAAGGPGGAAGRGGAGGARASRGPSGPGSARDEAERLVSSLLGAASVAIQSAETRRQLRDLAEAVQDTPAARQVRDLADRVLGGDWFGSPEPSGTTTTTSTTGATGGETRARTGFATGAPECCVCPVCRLISVLRDPSPEFAERVATGAGDLAAGLAQVMRAFGDAFAGSPSGGAPGDDPWESATRDSNADVHPPEQRKPMAKKAVRKPAPRDDG